MNKIEILTFYEFIKIVIWEFKDAAKPPPGVNQPPVLRQLIHSYERHRCVLAFLKMCITIKSYSEKYSDTENIPNILFG